MKKMYQTLRAIARLLVLINFFSIGYYFGIALSDDGAILELKKDILIMSDFVTNMDAVVQSPICYTGTAVARQTNNNIGANFSAIASIKARSRFLAKTTEGENEYFSPGIKRNPAIRPRSDIIDSS